ncbi:cyclohexadienyl dehydratase, partial [Bacillus cereus]|nr:cyclohexadienyl dehydratase [Bacillus cereus]
GFMLPKDDADYSRVMEFVWGLMDARGQLKQAADQWLR